VRQNFQFFEKWRRNTGVDLPRILTCKCAYQSQVRELINYAVRKNTIRFIDVVSLIQMKHYSVPFNFRFLFPTRASWAEKLMWHKVRVREKNKLTNECPLPKKLGKPWFNVQKSTWKENSTNVVVWRYSADNVFTEHSSLVSTREKFVQNFCEVIWRRLNSDQIRRDWDRVFNGVLFGP